MVSSESETGGRAPSSGSSEEFSPSPLLSTVPPPCRVGPSNALCLLLRTITRRRPAAVVARAGLLHGGARAMDRVLLRVGLELVDAGLGAEVIVRPLVRVLDRLWAAAPAGFLHSSVQGSLWCLQMRQQQHSTQPTVCTVQTRPMRATTAAFSFCLGDKPGFYLISDKTICASHPGIPICPCFKGGDRS